MSSDGADAMPYHINAIGLDIEKSAVAMATDYPEDVLYMVADLARIPVADKSIHLILNILTPANYKEFSRILMDDGLVLKVIPGTDYLKEIRAILEEESEPDAPDNATLNYNEGKIDIAYRQRIHDTCEVPDAHRHLFFEMSPLTKGKTISDYDIKKLKAITIDYELILGRPNIKLI
ncbi:MAG: hypothetical protein LBN22_11920, partial [Clostridiales Family XIII bacterium]|jgi:23S rRNA (guanine745-N1)-methyltransferase|nr:hypothetical protein [Clostridiales Family XIII bacterium]